MPSQMQTNRTISTAAAAKAESSLLPDDVCHWCQQHGRERHLQGSRACAYTRSWCSGTRVHEGCATQAVQLSKAVETRQVSVHTCIQPTVSKCAHVIMERKRQHDAKVAPSSLTPPHTVHCTLYTGTHGILDHRTHFYPMIESSRRSRSPRIVAVHHADHVFSFANLDIGCVRACR